LGRKPSPHPRACALSCPSRGFYGPGSYGAPALTLSWRRCRHSKRRRWKGAWWNRWLVSSRGGDNRTALRPRAVRSLRRFYGRGPSGRRPFASPHPKRLSTPSASPGPIGVGPTGRPGISVTMRYGGIGAERGGMDARKRDDTYHRGRGGRYIGHSPTAGTLGSCHSPGPLRSTLTSPAFLALSGRGYAELPLNGVLRSSLTSRLNLIDGVHLSERLHPPDIGLGYPRER
jgi:hypothetical protein